MQVACPSVSGKNGLHRGRVLWKVIPKTYQTTSITSSNLSIFQNDRTSEKQLVHPKNSETLYHIFLSRFIVILFTCHTIHPPEVYNSVFFQYIRRWMEPSEHSAWNQDFLHSPYSSGPQTQIWLLVSRSCSLRNFLLSGPTQTTSPHKAWLNRLPYTSPKSFHLETQVKDLLQVEGLTPDSRSIQWIMFHKSTMTLVVWWSPFSVLPPSRLWILNL